jgi:hypothetical protein
MFGSVDLGRVARHPTGKRGAARREPIILARQRRSLIFERVRDAGAVQVADPVRELRVSGMTIRRDLEILQDQGLLEKVGGGATVTTESALFEPGSAARSVLQETLRDRVRELVLVDAVAPASESAS